ncbi:tyrosine-type recombinase/integrase [Nocardia sp. NPDC050408]|uniref:tyrosine-type recombinase/integrase n=1 Tax=Nocardia sp. NPDC050408 TaxID=3364319 RepID=UPI0037ACA1A9
MPQPLSLAEATRLLGSLRTWRDRAMAGLMLYCGLRSCEVLGLDITDVDMGRGWLRVWDKGAKERATPLDGDVAQISRAVVSTWACSLFTGTYSRQREHGCGAYRSSVSDEQWAAISYLRRVETGS